MIDEKGLTGKAKDIKKWGKFIEPLAEDFKTNNNNVLDRVEDDNKDSDESITSVVKRKSSTPKKISLFVRIFYCINIPNIFLCGYLVKDNIFILIPFCLSSISLMIIIFNYEGDKIDK
jgi:hypothetical protein